MRICPNCSKKLKTFDYFFCSSCLSELPHGLYKIPKPILLNVKLNKTLMPSSRFLFWNIPYEYRFSAQFLFWSIIFVIVISILLLVNYNFKYGF